MSQRPSLPTKLDLGQLGASVVYRWKYVVIPALVAPVVLLVLHFVMPQKYKCTAQVLVQESISVNPFLEDMSVPWTVQQRLPVIQAILRSRMTLERVLRTLEEVDDNTTELELDERTDKLRDQIEVFGMGGGLVNISITGDDPVRIHKGLEELVTILIDAMLRPQKQSLEDASRFLEEQLKETRKSLSELENNIEVFKKEHVSELPEVFQANLNSYIDTQGSLLTAQTNLRAAQMRRRNLEQRLKIYNPVARELEAQLIEARTRLSELRAVYNDNHPEIVALEEHIKQLRSERAAANLGSESGKLDIPSLESAAQMRTDVSGGGATIESRTSDVFTSDLLEYKALSAEIAALQGTVSELEQQETQTLESVKSYAGTERTLAALMRDYEVKQSTYVTLLKKFEDSRVTKALSMYDEDQQIVLIEAPRQPTAPTGMPLVVLLLIAVASGAVLGITVIVVVEIASGVVRAPTDLAHIEGLEVIGRLPLVLDFKPGNPDAKHKA